MLEILLNIVKRVISKNSAHYLIDSSSDTKLLYVATTK
jgi:hypothetical protein